MRNPCAYSHLLTKCYLPAFFRLKLRYNPYIMVGSFKFSLKSCILNKLIGEFMKKIIIALVVIAVMAGGIAVIATSQNKPKDNNKTSSESATKKAGGKAACELLTLGDAKSLLGDNATLSEGSGAPNLATKDEVNVDNCTYSSDGATLGDLNQITIQRHYGDSDQVKLAYDNYQKEFPGEALAGLGDVAYFATEAKQVQVLKGDYWIFVFGGSINAGDEANKELEIKAAQLALKKL